MALGRVLARLRGRGRRFGDGPPRGRAAARRHHHHPGGYPVSEPVAHAHFIAFADSYIHAHAITDFHAHAYSLAHPDGESDGEPESDT